MRKLTVFYIHGKGAKNKLVQRLTVINITRGKKAIILIALIIPLLFLAVLLFCRIGT